MLLAALERALAEAGIGRRGDESRVLVAVSGGVDSVALLHGAEEILGGRRVGAAHVDHGVRPDSFEDAELVKKMAADLGVAFLLEILEATSDDEASLRRARYEALERQRASLDATVILTAHTLDDLAETVLMGLITSGTARSLRGIPRRRGPILRPLLDVPRHEVLRYAESRGFSWREDQTNREPRYLRNRVRKELLPLIESRYRPGIRRRLASIAREMTQLLSEE